MRSGFLKELQLAFVMLDSYDKYIKLLKMRCSMLVTMIALIWAGMILGVSLDNWAKFRAKSLTRPIALDVGRTVFRYFHHVQNSLLLIMIILSFVSGLPLIGWVTLVGIIIILAAQFFWLYPKLNERANIIIAGGNPPPAKIHAFYGMSEIIKCVLLLFLASILLY